jgi:hypothetical protein
MAQKDPKHSEGGTTTRDDALDSGVPMLAGDPSEPVGPEDALGSGKKRGDYSEVVGDKQHYHSVVNPDHDPSDPTSPAYVLVHQNPLVEQRGDEKGVKGGTHPLSDEVKK